MVFLGDRDFAIRLRLQVANDARAGLFHFSAFAGDQNRQSVIFCLAQFDRRV